MPARRGCVSDQRDDLLALQLAFFAAQDAVEDYGREVTQQRRRQYPDEDQWRERTVWPEDGPARATLARLRVERDTMARQLRQHPAMEQARATGTTKNTSYAAQWAARATLAAKTKADAEAAARAAAEADDGTEAVA